MSITLQALNNYLTVRIVEPARQTAGGILLPEKTLDRPRWSFVASVGEGQPDMLGRRAIPGLAPGDLIFMQRHGAAQIATDREECGEQYIIAEGDVYAKLETREDGASPRIAPMGNFVHIEPLADEALRKVGLIELPETAREKPSRARVLAVGPGQVCPDGTLVPPMIAEGDIVRFRKHAPIPMDFQDLGDRVGKQYLIPYGDILCVEREAP